MYFADNIFRLKSKFTTQCLQNEKQTALLAGRRPKLTKQVYTTQWSGKWDKKMCFYLPPVTRSSTVARVIQVLSNDITHQNKRFHWSLVKSPGNLHLTLRLHYIYITLFTARSIIFLPAAKLRVALGWPPRKPRVFARPGRWQ